MSFLVNNVCVQLSRYYATEYVCGQVVLTHPPIFSGALPRHTEYLLEIGGWVDPFRTCDYAIHVHLECLSPSNKDWRCFLWICATVANMKHIRASNAQSASAINLRMWKKCEALPELMLRVSALSGFRSAEPRTESSWKTIHPSS